MRSTTLSSFSSCLSSTPQFSPNQRKMLVKASHETESSVSGDRKESSKPSKVKDHALPMFIKGIIHCALAVPVK